LYLQLQNRIREQERLVVEELSILDVYLQATRNKEIFKEKFKEEIY